MPIRPKIAMFDLDRTLADFEGKLRQDMAQYSTLPMPELGTKWPAEYFKISELVKNQSGWWANLPPIQSGLEIFRYCVEKGFQTYVLTQASKGAINSWSEKAQWCERHLKPIARNYGVIMTQTVLGDESGQQEWLAAKGLVYARILVDDHVPFMDAWLTHRPRGVGLMPRYPQNEHFTHPQVVHYDAQEPLSVAVKEKIDWAFSRE